MRGNEPAFPVESDAALKLLRSMTPEERANAPYVLWGMSIRTYLAGQALAGMSGLPCDLNTILDAKLDKRVGYAAKLYADAVLKALEEGEPQ